MTALREQAVDPVRVTEETSLTESLRRLIERLPERERRIVALRYGIYDGRPRTREEIGDEFNLTGERIGQLEQLALCRLRHPSFGAGPDLLGELNPAHRPAHLSDRTIPRLDVAGA